MIGCAGFASRPLEIRTATKASAENATDAISRTVRPSRREPPAKSTKESAKVAALEKELERYQQAEKKSDENPHSKRQMRRRRQHTKCRSKLLDNCRQLDCSPTTTRRSSRSKQSWTAFLGRGCGHFNRFMVQTVQTVWRCRCCSSSSRTLTSLLVALRQIPVVPVRFHSCRTLGG